MWFLCMQCSNGIDHRSIGRMTSLGFMYSRVLISKLLENDDTKQDLPIIRDDTSIFRTIVARSTSMQKLDFDFVH